MAIFPPGVHLQTGPPPSAPAEGRPLGREDLTFFLRDGEWAASGQLSQRARVPLDLVWRRDGEGAGTEAGRPAQRLVVRSGKETQVELLSAQARVTVCRFCAGWMVAAWTGWNW